MRHSNGCGRAAARLPARPPSSRRGRVAPAANSEYAPIFYPGTAIAADATPIRVDAGDERRGVDFVVDLVPAVTIRGQVATSDGSPLTDVLLWLVGRRTAAAEFRGHVVTDRTGVARRVQLHERPAGSLRADRGGVSAAGGPGGVRRFAAAMGAVDVRRAPRRSQRRLADAAAGAVDARPHRVRTHHARAARGSRAPACRTAGCGRAAAAAGAARRWHRGGRQRPAAGGGPRRRHLRDCRDPSRPVHRHGDRFRVGRARRAGG